MPAGLQIFGSHGVIQIDETHKNFVVVQQGSKVSGDWSFSGGSYFTSVVVTNAVAPLVAYKSDAVVAFVHTSISGSTWTFGFRSDTPDAMSFWVFDEAPASSPDNFGLEIYNASGQRVFHSSQKPMKVVGTTTGTYASGRTYAVMVTTASYHQSSVPSGLPFPEEWQGYDSATGYNVNANLISEGSVTLFNGYTINEGGNYDDPAPSPIVVDVTYF